MPQLTVTKNYADNTVLFQLQLNQAFESLETFINNTKLDSDNIQTSGISSGNIAANAVTTEKINTAAITLAKLAAEVSERLNPAGAILAYGGDAIPNGYLYCDGTQVSRVVYASLFTAIGTKFGQGDGSTTFHLPDFRGRFLRGFDNGAGRDPDAASRTAMNLGGVTGDGVGSVQLDAMQSHNHGGGDHGHTATIGGFNNNDENSGNLSAGGTNFITAEGVTTTNSGTIITTDGGSVENRPKNANVRYLIKY